MKFKLWLENENELQIKIKSAFDQARTALIGGTDDYNTALGKISSRNRSGARAAEDLLGNVFVELQNLSQYKPELANAEKARHWLSQIGSGDISVNANHTVGTLLKMMFGDKMYGEFSGQPVPSSDVKEPVAGGGFGQDVTQAPEEKPQEQPTTAPLQPPNQRQIGQEFSTNLVSHRLW